MKRLNKFILTLALILLSSTAVSAAVQEITARNLKTMMENGDVLVVFPLSSIEYNNLHISGSVNIPMDQLETELPENKEKTIAFYCLGRN